MFSKLLTGLAVLSLLSMVAATTYIDHPPRADSRCGPFFGNASCSTSNATILCCSQDGQCGKTLNHCNWEGLYLNKTTEQGAKCTSSNDCPSSNSCCDLKSNTCAWGHNCNADAENQNYNKFRVERKCHKPTAAPAPFQETTIAPGDFPNQVPGENSPVSPKDSGAATASIMLAVLAPLVLLM